MSLTTEPRFLYPCRYKFAFDHVCEQIVHALEERNWEVPGITIKFANYENGGTKDRYVESVAGDDFRLDFIFESYSSAPVTTLAIPGKRLSVYSDNSGPRYYVYVGNDWEQDKRHFLDDYLMHSKLDGKPRTYLLYEGGCMCEQKQYVHRHDSRVAPLLIHNDDSRREYELEIGEPSQYQTKAVFQEFSHWLQKTLLTSIQSHPLPTTKTDPLAQRLIPFPETIGPIFGFGSRNDARRIYQGKQDPQSLAVTERYGLGGSQFSLLVPQTNPESDEKYSIEYSSFRSYGLGAATPTTPASQLSIPGQYRELEKSYVFKVTPTDANGIYVVDHAVYTQSRKDLFAAIAPRDRLTNSELNEAYAAFRSTQVLISEYDGSYTEPVVRIGRALDLDEVELISGPWPECQYIDLISHYNDETAKLFEELIQTQEAYDRDYKDDSAKATRDSTLATLGAHFMGDEQFKQTVKEFAANYQFGPVDTLLFLRVIAYAASAAREVGL